MTVSRRDLVTYLLAASLAHPRLARGAERRRIAVIAAPTNLGLRPAPGGVIPGTWKMAEVLLEAGLDKKIGAARVEAIDRIPYQEEAQVGTRIRNGHSIRRFSLDLASRVTRALNTGEFPVVLGGDCSVLLGCLVGARGAGARGLIHVDGHSDFFHPGNYDTNSRLGTAAGMDLALATGRGETLLTQWPEVAGALVADEDVIQVGERDAEDPLYKTAAYGDILETKITQITIQTIHSAGLAAAVSRVLARLAARSLDRVWLHVDLDVLDQSVLPAVDSPGAPGLSAAELTELLQALIASQRVVGVDFTIYDPDLDPQRRYTQTLVETIARGLSGLIRVGS